LIAINPAFARMGDENAFAVLARAAELQRRGHDVVNLGIGQPDFKTAPHIVEAAVKALRDGEHGYTDASGIAPLREAVSEDLKRRFGVEVPPDLVLITPGGKVAMYMAILMFGAEGAEIVYPDPGFPIYRSMIEFTGARPVPAPMREENGFAFSAEETLSLLTPQTRLLILNSPANPTGGVTPRGEIDKLVAGLAAWPNLAILSDEIYGQLIYDRAEHRSLLSYPELRDRLVLLDGWSKTYAMTGWRLGYSVWPKPWREVARKLAVNSYSCVNSAAQFAGIAALKGSQDSVETMRVEFDRRRKAVVAGLNRGHAHGGVLRLPQYRPHRLEGEAARFSAARRSRGRDRRRSRFWRIRRGLPASLLRQLSGKHRTRARAYGRVSRPLRLGQRERIEIVFGGS
jgi:aspartate/methionine/tyrosine aminotransferase